MKLTDDQRELISRVNCTYPEQSDVNAVNNLLPACPNCGGALTFNVSPCMDLECCGVPNSILCTDRGCIFDYELYGDLVDLFERFLDGEAAGE